MRYRIDIDTEVAQRVLADGSVPALRLTGGLPAQAKIELAWVEWKESGERTLVVVAGDGEGQGEPKQLTPLVVEEAPRREHLLRLVRRTVEGLWKNNNGFRDGEHGNCLLCGGFELHVSDCPGLELQRLADGVA